MSMPPYSTEQVQPYGPPAGPQTQPPKRKRSGNAIALIVAVFVGACIVGGIIIGAVANVAKNTPDPTATASAAGVRLAEPAPTVTVTKTVIAKPKPSQPANTKAKVTATLPPKPITVGDGTWEVGTEIKAGTYTTTSDGYCYWARLKDFDGELDSITTNGNLDPGGRGRITVRKSDTGLELAGGCTWTRK